MAAEYLRVAKILQSTLPKRVETDASAPSAFELATSIHSTQTGRDESGTANYEKDLDFNPLYPNG